MRGWLPGAADDCRGGAPNQRLEVCNVMTKPRLSICIATFNRADYIGETLESILPQVTEEVEIVIVDGASTDATGDVVKRYIEVCPQIHYTRLPSKGGVDQDYCKAVELARGDYCWLFTDDDLLRANAINTVLDATKYGYSLIIMNAQVMNADFSRILIDKLLKLNTNEIYDKLYLDNLFQCIVPYISFIGGVIINRNLWLQREKEKYFGTEFVHVGVIFQDFLPASTLVIAEPYITIRFGNAQWTTRAFEVWMYKWPDLVGSFSCISEQLRREYQKRQSWRRLKGIIIHRARREYSLREFKKWISLENTLFWWRLVTLFIAVIPSRLVDYIIIIYLKLLNKEALRSWHC
jgi:glycosyltransferase involved in cell wall biosynthesis